MIGREFWRLVSSSSPVLVRRLGSRQWLPAVDAAPATLGMAATQAAVARTGSKEACGVAVPRTAKFHATTLLTAAGRQLPAPRAAVPLAVAQLRFSSGHATAPRTAATAATAEAFENFVRTMDPAGFIEDLVARHPVFVISKQTCPFCTRVKTLLSELGATFEPVELDGLSSDAKLLLQDHLRATTGAGSVPRVFISGKCLGGFDETHRKLVAGDLVPALVAVRAADGSAPKAKIFTDVNPFF